MGYVLMEWWRADGGLANKVCLVYDTLLYIDHTCTIEIGTFVGFT